MQRQTGKSYLLNTKSQETYESQELTAKTEKTNSS